MCASFRRMSCLSTHSLTRQCKCATCSTARESSIRACFTSDALISARGAFHISKIVSLSFSCVVLLVKTYSFLCCFFFDLPNPFRQVGILDLRADILLSSPRQPVQHTKVVGVDVGVHFSTEASDRRNVGPHFGSPDHLPFFKLRIESAVHWSDILCRNSTGPPTIHMPHAVPLRASTLMQ